MNDRNFHVGWKLHVGRNLFHCDGLFVLDATTGTSFLWRFLSIVIDEVQCQIVANSWSTGGDANRWWRLKSTERLR